MRPLSFPTVLPFCSLWVWGVGYRAGHGKVSIASVRSRQHSFPLDFSTSSLLRVSRCSVLEMGEEGGGTQPGRRF